MADESPYGKQPPNPQPNQTPANRSILTDRLKDAATAYLNHRTAEDARHGWTSFREWGTFLGIALYTVITAVILGFGAAQYREIQRFDQTQQQLLTGQTSILSKQADLLSRQTADAEAVQRAFVSASLTVTPARAPIDFGAKTEGAGWRFEYILENNGTTPTISLAEFGGFVVCDPSVDSKSAPGPQNFQLPISAGARTMVNLDLAPRDCGDLAILLQPDPADQILNGSYLVRHYAVAPHQRSPINSVVFPDAYLRDLLARGKIWAYGAVVYDDVFGQATKHVTYFCDVISPGETRAGTFEPIFDPCQHWNCVDAGCKQDKKSYREDARAYARKEGLDIPQSLAGQD